MLKLKRITFIICSALLVLAIAGCSSGSSKPIPLTEDESEVLAAMGDDVNVITNDDYSRAVIELQAHPGSFSGQVYQLEGVYTTESINGVDTPFVYRTLVHDGEKTTCGLPLKYLVKEIPDGAWIRVTAIIGTEDYDGETCTVMETVAVEALAKAGKSQMEWDGVGHQH